MLASLFPSTGKIGSLFQTGCLYVLKFGYGIKLQSLENGPLYFPVKENGRGNHVCMPNFCKCSKKLIYIYITQKQRLKALGSFGGNLLHADFG